MGTHKIGSQHALLGTQSRQSLGIHTSFVEVHELLWVAMRYYGRPQDFLGDHAIALAVHKKLWVLIRYTWTSNVYRSALPRVTCGLTRYLHGRTRDFVGVHDRMYWTATRDMMHIHTHCSERPRGFVGTHCACAWSPTKKLEPHAFCWATTWQLVEPHAASCEQAMRIRWHPAAHTLRAYERRWARVYAHERRWAHTGVSGHGWVRMCMRTHVLWAGTRDMWART